MAAATFVNSFDKEMYSRQGDFADSEYIVSFSGNALGLFQSTVWQASEEFPLYRNARKPDFVHSEWMVSAVTSDPVEFDYPKKILSMLRM